MQILGLSGGSPNGNSEILLKTALQAAQEIAPPDAQIHFVRVPDISIPRHFRVSDAKSAQGAIEQSADPSATNEPDDRPFVLRAIMEADIIILSCPIYTRTIPGIVKHFQDMTMGPFQDTAMARHRQRMAAATGDSSSDEDFELLFKPRVAGLMAVGGAAGTDWTPFGLPLMHQMFFSMGIQVVSQFQVNGCGLPGSILLDAAALEKARQLGVLLVSQAGKQDVTFQGPQQGTCPLCHLDMIVVKDGNEVECATCGAQGRFVVEPGENLVTVEFNEEGRKSSVLTETGKDLHLQEIMRVAGSLRPRMAEVADSREHFKKLDTEWLVKFS
ncbi:flavoprotein-like protein [Aspergillus pseudoustus]|uniref:Flavoprotein-like protein n=1 Tax=Aspergillus pseudoustus TaxID=1810923 RepID=A0ABR4IPM1_9EURO